MKEPSHRFLVDTTNSAMIFAEEIVLLMSAKCGSPRDAKVINACNDYNMFMAFSQTPLFHH